MTTIRTSPCQGRTVCPRRCTEMLSHKVSDRPNSAATSEDLHRHASPKRQVRERQINKPAEDSSILSYCFLSTVPWWCVRGAEAGSQGPPGLSLLRHGRYFLPETPGADIQVSCFTLSFLPEQVSYLSSPGRPIGGFSCLWCHTVWCHHAASYWSRENGRPVRSGCL